MADIKRGGLRRAAKLAGLPAGVAGRAALGVGKRMTGKSKDEVNAELLEKAADEMFKVLGELKGGAMKVGQALSVMEAAIPPQFAEPFRETLVKLQSEAPPLPAPKVHRVLDAQLGIKWRDRFQSFDDTAVASASIGQVHKGVWHDGREVAVKIQYPGADEALRADLKLIQRFSWVAKQVVPGADVDRLVAEINDTLEAELDYRQEAQNQRAFAKGFAGDPKFAVPAVIASAPRVMVSEWLDGRRVSAVIADGTREERDSVAGLLIEFTFSSPARVGLVHADPHPGNFMLLPDGRLGVIDFGAVAEHPGGLPAGFGELLCRARDEQWDEAIRLLKELGFMSANYDLTAEQLVEYLQPLWPYIDPLRSGEFHFTRKWFRKSAIVTTDPLADGFGDRFKMARQMTIPPGYVMLLRTLGGLLGVAVQLDATTAYADLIERWVPGFFPPRGAPPQST
ncbi:AarF/ABC1/UbiB kinase family protein [Mycobacterium paragordonae]|uniref:ABC transporter, ATP-binding protein n=1 Tax=Mycobacterium paragordonae TaxID=1389713 RepID=A0A386UEN9_9MYCO|nr:MULTISPECIES: AarF/UbiB family protein [Mycobacterium]PJE22775.1 MAG: ABC transporter ATP-binding protein [Mycobacterium sp.]AYE98758.1 AarF/ABC1/UbiB kinase family protein [Mycobacterium paragordonae]MDP7735582.1 AarF/UbiB family protein [Mycobacterium paragordonae]OBJ91165.1 ABC transporter ATP-binding protein [Mycobacterium gordonae]OBK53005.1 ABC transporter ATP-binding protein [Mycobacterium gordonae]